MINLSDLSTVKKLARSWLGLANAGKTIEDIEQEILLAQLEFEAGLRPKDPSENIGSLYCEIAGDRQISIGGTGECLDEEDFLPIAGAGIEHIDPLLLLEIIQYAALGMQKGSGIPEIKKIDEFDIAVLSANEFASMLGVTTRQVRNIKKSLSKTCFEQKI